MPLGRAVWLLICATIALLALNAAVRDIPHQVCAQWDVIGARCGVWTVTGSWWLAAVVAAVGVAGAWAMACLPVGYSKGS